MIGTKYKVGQKGIIYKSKDKTGYSLRNAKIKAKRIKKKVQKADAINKRLETNRIRAKARAGKRRIQKQRKKASDIKRRNWKRQAKNKEKYESKKKRKINKAKKRRNTSWSYY